MSCDHGTCACNDTDTTDASEHHGHDLPTVAGAQPTEQASGCCGGHGHRAEDAAGPVTGN